MTKDPRKSGLVATADQASGVLTISIGLDTLDDLRKLLGVEDSRVSSADIAEFIVDKDEDGVASPFKLAIRIAVANAQAWDDEHERMTEPSSEFMRWATPRRL